MFTYKYKYTCLKMRDVEKSFNISETPVAKGQNDLKPLSYILAAFFMLNDKILTLMSSSEKWLVAVNLKEM